MRPDLSVPGGSYHKKTIFFLQIFEKVPGDNIKNSSLITRQKFKTLETDANEQIVLLEVKCLYNKTLVSEAIEVALQWFTPVTLLPILWHSSQYWKHLCFYSN